MTENEATKKYVANIIGSYASYRKSVGLGKPGMLIVANRKEDVPKISKAVRRLFPYYQQQSRYALTHGEFAVTYRQLVLSLVAGIAIVAALLTLIFVFLNKQSIAQRRKELGILFSLGYQKKDVKKIIALEIFNQFVAIYAGAMVVTFVLKRFVLDRTAYGRYFDNLYTLSNQLIIIGVLLITIAISTLWGVSAVKKKKLIDSLK